MQTSCDPSPNVQLHLLLHLKFFHYVFELLRVTKLEYNYYSQPYRNSVSLIQNYSTQARTGLTSIFATFCVVFCKTKGSVFFCLSSIKMKLLLVVTAFLAVTSCASISLGDLEFHAWKLKFGETVDPFLLFQFSLG